MKRCRICLVEKDETEFYPHKQTRDRLMGECKECSRAAANRYREEHPTYTADRWRDNKVELSAQHRDYVARKLLEDPEWRHNRYVKCYYSSPDVRAKAIARAIIWCAENPERRNLIGVAYAERRRGMIGDAYIGPDEIEQLFESFGWTCAYCGRSDAPLTVDHVLALSRGGRHEIENLVPACRSCNSRKNARGILCMVNVSNERRQEEVSSNSTC